MLRPPRQEQAGPDPEPRGRMRGDAVLVRPRTARVLQSSIRAPGRIGGNRVTSRNRPSVLEAHRSSRGNRLIPRSRGRLERADGASYLYVIRART
jgi:hypothetical protein